MKIVFMGTPEFAAVALEALAESEHEIGYVISQPDKAKNRGKKVMPTPVKAKAEEYGLRVLQPEKIRTDPETIGLLKEYAPDLIIVAAYGQLLPKEVLDIPKISCVNIHASLLPKYRGAAPIQWSIINGEEKTGITLMQMEEGLDTGDMIAKAETAIGKKTFAGLHDELAMMGAELLVKTLPQLEDGTAPRIPQQDELSCYAPMLFKKDGMIDFSKPAVEIERLMRGFPSGAYTELSGETLKLWAADCSEEQSGRPAGTVLSVSEKGIEIATGNGVLIVTEIQAAGKKRMKVSEFLKGNQLPEGTLLGQEMS